MFRLHRLAALLGFVLLSGALAAPLSADLPLQADVPIGWVQTRLPGPALGASIKAPGSPSPVALVVFAAPLGRQASASDLGAFIAGVEGAVAGAGQVSLIRQSEAARTVGGIRGVERRYVMLVKASGLKLATRIWFGAGPRYLYQFQMTASPDANAAQTASFEQLLHTVTFKTR